LYIELLESGKAFFAFSVPYLSSTILMPKFCRNDKYTTIKILLKLTRIFDIRKYFCDFFSTNKQQQKITDIIMLKINEISISKKNLGNQIFFIGRKLLILTRNL